MRKVIIFTSLALLTLYFLGTQLPMRGLSSLIYSQSSNIAPSKPSNTTMSIQASKIDKASKSNNIIGKLTIPGTIIDYFVVKGTDNVYYLHHSINHREDIKGSIFMDYRNKGDLRDNNTIVYGHNMKDGTMFKGLMAYKRRDFFENNRYIFFYSNSLKKTLKYEIFSAYVTDTNFNYIKTNFSSTDEFIFFLNTLKSKSNFSSRLPLNKTDNILTLSTCSYEFKDARFVVHAKLISN